MAALYERMVVKGHPRADKDGLVYTHVIVAENMLGRYLCDDETVHHRDMNKHNNNPENLMVFKTNADHGLFHQGCEAILDGDTYVCVRKKRICASCNGEFLPKSNRQRFCNRACACTSHRKVERPSKEELERELLKANTYAVSKKYGVSWNAIKKWKNAYGIS